MVLLSAQPIMIQGESLLLSSSIDITARKRLEDQLRQSQKMGYNAIMVHAYGNNPMVSFTFNGKTKPVGYLSTTVKGRDWSTMHVNDVRRLWGGQVFDGPDHPIADGGDPGVEIFARTRRPAGG